MDFEWDSENVNRFNPMDSCKHDRVDIAVLEAIDALRLFVAGQTGVCRMSNEDFADLLRVSAASADRVD